MQFTTKKQRKVIINITSLIDVLFLLLIFFMVSSTFIEQPGMKLELPESKSSAPEKIDELILEMNSDGSIMLNESTVQISELGTKFKEALPLLENKSLVLKADKNVPHGQVVEVMDIAKLSGLEKLIIATKTSTKSN